ncbi:hypothetical protein B7494_g3453 [Chlorociboria aeruginascens]|nr:hypothetical protein B7494_g3453 [Chlorociboria aeruginascens]
MSQTLNIPPERSLATKRSIISFTELKMDPACELDEKKMIDGNAAAVPLPAAVVDQIKKFVKSIFVLDSIR